MATENFLLSNIGGFVKAINADAGLVSYIGNNLNITIRDENFIQISSADARIVEDNLDRAQRLDLTIDFANLTDKLGAVTAEQYVEILISSGELEVQAGALAIISADIASLLKETEKGVSRGISAFDFSLSAPATVIRLCYAIRVKSASLPSYIERLSANAYTTTANRDFQLFIIKNPVISVVPSFVPVTGSIVESFIGDGNVSVSGGILMMAGIVKNGAVSIVSIEKASENLAVNDIFAVAVLPVSNTGVVLCDINWTEKIS